MTDKLRAAAQRALETLEDIFGKNKIDVGAINMLRAALAEPEQAAPDEYGYASRLAVALWEKHYKATSANWEPLPDLIGVLTQIDNMTASLVRRQAR